jgi:hypothetical protein
MPKSSLASITAAIFIVALGSAPLLAQDTNPEAVTAESIDPANPFGELPTGTVVGTENPDIPGFVEGLSAEQRTELDERCTIIAENRDRFSPEAGAFCESYPKSQ